MPIIEDEWECFDCKRAHILGRYKNCPGCGHARNPEETPSETPRPRKGATEVVDPELLQLALAGPDRICDHCGSSVAGNRRSCQSCGNTVTEDDKPWLVSQKLNTFSKQNLPTALPRRKRVNATSVLQQETISNVGLPSVKERHLKWAAGTAGVGLMIWMVWFFFLSTETVTLQVTDLQWRREVEVEEYRTLVEDDWSIPQGGRELRNYEEIHHYESVFSHTETRTRQVPYTVTDSVYVSRTCSRSLGNGFSETYDCGGYQSSSRTEYRTEVYTENVYVDVPVYETKYEYEIERWVNDRWDESSSQDGAQPFWAEPVLEDETFRIGNGRRETYTVFLNTDEDGAFEREIDFDVWRKLDVGTELPGAINRQGNLLRVEWPE